MPGWFKDVLDIFKGKQPTPQEVADQAERILSGRCLEWDVDDYENRNPQNAKIKDLHLRTLSFGLPEEWVRLDDVKKNALREIIQEMRQTAIGPI